MNVFLKTRITFFTYRAQKDSQDLSNYHPIVGFGNQNSLYENFLVGNATRAGVCF